MLIAHPDTTRLGWYTTAFSAGTSIAIKGGFWEGA